MPLFCIAIGKNLGEKLECLGEKLPPTPSGRLNPDSYNLNCAGGRAVHSYGRLIPHEFPITDLQQISGPDGIGRITCTVSSGAARFFRPGRQLETDGVTETRNGDTATLVVNPANVDSFHNRDLYCNKSAANFFYLFISSASKCTINMITYIIA